MYIYLIIAVTSICPCLLIASFSLWQIADYLEKLYYIYKRKNDGK